MERVRTALDQLQQQSGFVVVFSHGFFIKAMLWQILANPTVIDAVAMNRLLGFSRGFPVPNASILQMEFDSGGIAHWSSFITNHLPPELESASTRCNCGERCRRSTLVTYLHWNHDPTNARVALLIYGMNDSICKK
jgi:hypothetical protein